MTWHPTPRDDEWRKVHLAYLEASGLRAWLRCDGCNRSFMMEPRALAEKHGLDMLTPLLTKSKRMRCQECGARKGACWPEPYKGIGR